mgnify:CR=1 FL=1
MLPQPLAQLPLRHSATPGIARIRLASSGRANLALAAYAAYVINAAQFLLKLRAARLDGAQRGAVGQRLQSLSAQFGAPTVAPKE